MSNRSSNNNGAQQHGFSIRHKLLMLLLSSLVLTTVLVGISLDIVLRTHFKGVVEDDLSWAFSRIYDEFAEERQGVSAQANILVGRNDLVASLNMLSEYATPERYDPGIYDPEKEYLAEELHEQLRASGVSQIELYAKDGRLLAYAEANEREPYGYRSYRDEADIFIARHKGQWRESTPPETTVLNLTNHSLLQSTPVLTLCCGGLLLQVVRPLERSFQDGSKLVVGYVRVSLLVGEKFINYLHSHIGLPLTLYLPNDKILGTDVHVDFNVNQDLPDLTHTNSNYRLFEDRLDYHGGMSFSLDSGESVPVYISYPKERVAAAVTEGRQWVGMILLLSIFVLTPLVMWLARRTITKPISDLVEGVDAYQQGDYSKRIEPHSEDELGTLTTALNTMARSVQHREKALVESENKYRMLVEHLPQRVFTKDCKLNYRSCNVAFAGDLGLTPEELVGKSDYDLFSRQSADKYRADDLRVMETGRMLELEESFTGRDNKEVTVQTVKTPIYNMQGDVVGVLGIFWDITERKRNERELRQAAAVFENTADGVIITDPSTHIVAVNRAFTEITGYRADEVIGRPVNLRRSSHHDKDFYRKMWVELQQKGSWRGEIWNRRKDGQINPEWLSISSIRDEDGEVSHYVAVFSDISAIKESQAQLDHLAHHDPLTDLPNRVLLNDRLVHAIDRAGRNHERLAILFLDLDRFKIVNDTLGHPVGDKLLRAVSQRLLELLRKSDTVSRLGGDEFVVLMEDVDNLERVESVAGKILSLFTEPFHLDGNEVYLGASIGITLFPDDGTTAESLIKNADAAMYRAKESGRNTYQFYTEDLTANAMERIKLEAALRVAVQNKELALYYQPQINLETGRVEGVEALVRWHHPVKGIIPPDSFIYLAEETGLIVPVGDWVIEEACRQMRLWQERGCAPDKVAVNLSGIQIQRGEIVDTVEAVLSRTGLPAECLELEITESAIMSSAEQTTELLNRLRTLGVGLAVDDFGTGYSSLAYLKRFPINKLKIDKSFVRDLPHDGNDVAIVRSIIALAHSLQLEVTAEGIEVEEQQQFLIEQGCHHGQGYLYSKALPAEEATGYLQRGDTQQ